MNKVIISGNLCQEPEVKQTQNGKEVVTNCVAVQREYKDANGNYETDFINIVVWGASATYLGRYAHRGDRVELCGRWTVRKYTANDGTTKIVNECIVDSIRAFNKQPKEDAPQYMPDAYSTPKFEELPNDEELPF